MLTRLYADNFRCFVNFECRFGPSQLILGSNGAGKSSIFDVLRRLRNFCVSGNPLEGFFSNDGFAASTRTRWLANSYSAQTFELDVEANGGSYRFKLVIDALDVLSPPQVIREELTFNGGSLFLFDRGVVHLFDDENEEKVHYPFDATRSALATITDWPFSPRLTWFKNWLGNLLVFSPDPRQMSGIASQETRTPTVGLTNFADWYRHVRLEEESADYLSDLREVVQGLDTMQLVEAGERRRELRIRFKGEKEPYFLNELSDGQRALVGLYAALHFGMKQQATVCFDEPDNFIALREIQPWLSKVLEMTEVESGREASQVLVASHHPELLNRLAFRSGLLLDRPEGRHVRVRPFADALETGLTAAELVSRGWEGE